jgi:hypothetical protein
MELFKKHCPEHFCFQRQTSCSEAWDPLVRQGSHLQQAVELRGRSSTFEQRKCVIDRLKDIYGDELP